MRPLAALWLIVAFILFQPFHSLAQSGSVVRSGPSYYRPGISLALTNTAAPLADIFLQTVEQAIPAGWNVGAISHEGRFQAPTGKVTWGPFFDGLTRRLTVILTPPTDATGRVAFSGGASFDGAAITPSGLTYLDPAPAPTGSVKRSLPTYYLPGQTLALTNVVTLEPGVDAYAVEEVLPEGWSLIEANEFGTILTNSTHLRWGPFMDGIPRNLTATIRVPDSASGTLLLDGNAYFGSLVVAIAGSNSVAQGGLGSGSITRRLASTYVPGIDLIVTNQVRPGAGTGLVLIEENPPSGWSVTNISHNGSFDSSLGLVKWGPFMDETARQLTYTLTPPTNADGSVSFSGRGTFDQATFTTLGVTNFSRLLADSGSISRTLPSCQTPGQAFYITNRVVPQADVTAYGVIEQVPTGWSVNDAGIGNWDSTLNRITWGPFFDNLTRTLVYQVTAPPDSRATMTFDGYATFGSNTITNAGPTELAACPVGHGNAARSGYSYFIPGVQTAVTVVVTPDTGVGSYLLQEFVPTGWTVDSISDFGSFDSANRILKWGPFLDDLPRALSYRMTPPNDAAAGVTLAGTVYFDGVPTDVLGVTSIPRNQPPTLTDIPSLETPEDTPLVIVFSAADAETASDQLSLQFTSDNPTLFPSVTFGTSGANHTLTLVPATNTSGLANASIILSDGISSVTRSFSLAVTAVNDPPTLQVPASVTVWQGAAPFPISGFSLDDQDVASGLLRLSLTNLLGSLTVTNLGSSSVVHGTNGTASLVLEGSLLTLQNALNSLVLAFPSSFSGAAQLDIALDDQGGTGLGGPQVTTGIVPLSVLAIAEPIHAIADLLERPAGRSVKVRASKLLANDVDIDARTLTLTGVSPTSAHGATVALEGVWVTYSPAAGYDSTDTFTYQVSNGAGDTATGTVTVMIQGASAEPTANVISLSYLPSTGYKQVRFQGIPGRTYRIQVTDSLYPADWVTLALVTSGANGVYEFTDSDTSRPARYYRSVWP